MSTMGASDLHWSTTRAHLCDCELTDIRVVLVDNGQEAANVRQAVDTHFRRVAQGLPKEDRPTAQRKLAKRCTRTVIRSLGH